MKRITIFLAIILLVVMTLSVPVAAEGDLGDAQYYSIGTSMSGDITEINSADEYFFDLYTSGRIALEYTGNGMECSSLSIYDESGKELWNSEPYWESATEQISFSEEIELTGGEYYFSVSEYYGYGSYDFTIDFTSASETFEEVQGGSNNTINDASLIELNGEYTGHIALNDEVDVYSFDLSSSGEVVLSYTGYGMEESTLKIFDESGKEIWSSNPYWESMTEQISFSEKVELSGGGYYLSVSEYNGYGSYDFTIDFTSANETFDEEQGGSNNTINDASLIELNGEYTGHIALNDEVDVYSFDLSSSGEVVLSYTGYGIEESTLKIFDESGEEIWSSNPYWESTTEQISFSEDIELSSGGYYFSVSKDSGYGAYFFEFSFEPIKVDPTPVPTRRPVSTPTPSPVYEPEPTYPQTFSVYPNYEDPGMTSFGSNVSDWAKAEVEEAYENNLIPETIMGDDLTEYVNRSEFAAISVQLYEELSGQTVSVTTCPFDDISEDENFYEIAKAFSLGITNGTSPTTFEPYLDIAREDLATMLCRAIKKYGFPDWSLERDGDYHLDTSGVSKFADDAYISDYAKTSVYYMTKFGVIKGVDDTHFAPRNLTAEQEAEGYATATREQAILMSLRILKNSDVW